MYYQFNKETQKIELITGREDYAALTEEQKKSIKSAFLFSRSLGGWVSRAKFPHTGYAEQIAQKIGAENRGKIGDALTFAEQIERKAERAEARAERAEHRAEAAERRGEALQKPINDMRGDIAFFTQPNINTSAGRAFTRQRQRMFDAYDRGFEEFSKSEYWRGRAETARATASGAQFKDKGFVMRRIDEAEKNARQIKKQYDAQARTVERIEAGETVKSFYGDVIDLEKARASLENCEERLEQELDKLGFYQDILESLGGVQFSKANLKKGDLLILERWKEPVRFVRGGPKNFTFEFTLPHMKYADGSPMQGQAAYAEIKERAEQA